MDGGGRQHATYVTAAGWTSKRIRLIRKKRATRQAHYKYLGDGRYGVAVCLILIQITGLDQADAFDLRCHAPERKKRGAGREGGEEEGKVTVMLLELKHLTKYYGR